LTRRLVDEIVSLSAEETSGRSGAELAGLLFEKMALRLAREYVPRVDGSTLEERLRSAAALLANDGFDYEVGTGADGLRLLGRGCPCARFGASGTTPGACEHDRRLLETLIGATVTPLPASALPTEFACGYAVKAADDVA